MPLLIAFGDVHGCHQAAERAVQTAEELKARAIFLGDYVDRGPSSAQTLCVLSEAKRAHPDWVFLRGNHDQMLLDLIEDKRRPDEIGEALGMNFDYRQTRRSLEEWFDLSVERRAETLAFLHGTEFYHRTEHFVFLHALLRDTGEGLHEKSSDELLWNYSYEPIWTGPSFVHGHLPVPTPTVQRSSEENPRRAININTECGYGGQLTGILIDERCAHENAWCQGFVAICENGSDGETANYLTEF
jgi:serine/threonine protein phosphatase 1